MTGTYIAAPQISLKTDNKGNTELHYLFIAAESIVDAVSFIRHIDCSAIQKQVLPKSGYGQI